MIFVLDNLNVQLASKIGPRATYMCLKDGMMWPLMGDDFSSLVMCRSDVEANFTIWPLALPTHTLGAAGLVFWYGAAG